MKEFFHNLKMALNSAEVKTGDIVYVASDITVLMYEAAKLYGVKNKVERDKFLNEFIDTFQNIVGKNGTLLFPIFTWKFCKGIPFDINNTLGEVGVLANWILKNRKDFVRTRHPIYSFMVWGKDASYLKALKNIDAWRDDSPFAYLHNYNAKMLLFNVALQRGFTFMHYVEKKLKVPYRYNKKFVNKYIDEFGIESIKTYSMYVRDLDIVSYELLQDSFLENYGIVKIANINSQTIKIFNFNDAFEILKNDFSNNNAKNCYKFEDYVIDWSKGATHNDEISYGVSE